MPICVPLRQTARQGRVEPEAINFNFFGSGGRPAKFTRAPVAEILRTVQKKALRPDSIVAGVVTGCRGTDRRSSTEARSAVRGPTMLNTPLHSAQV